jgi:hypothetical protein
MLRTLRYPCSWIYIATSEGSMFVIFLSKFKYWCTEERLTSDRAERGPSPEAWAQAKWTTTQRSISLLNLIVALLFHMQAYDIHFDTWEHMLLPPEKTFWNVKKSKSKFNVYISTFYVRMPSFVESWYFLCVVSQSFFSTEFTFLHTTQKLPFFVKWLCEHKEAESYAQNILSGLFGMWNFVQNIFWKTGSIVCSSVPKYHPHPSHFILEWKERTCYVHLVEEKIYGNIQDMKYIETYRIYLLLYTKSNL